jgi:hypothetical protein
MTISAQERIDRIIDKYTSGDCDLGELEDLLGQAGVSMEGSAWFIPSVADSDFSPDALFDRLSEERFEQLVSGEAPTPDEIVQWRSKLREAALAGESFGLLLSFWRATHTDGREIWWGTLHGDRGVIERVIGPASTLDELVKTAGSRGEVVRDS